MLLSKILSFLIASIALTIMPGPDNIYVVTESITHGSRTGIWISIGLISGIIIHTAAAATGISILIQQSEIVFNVIKYVGAAYLFYLAIEASQEEQIKVNIQSQDTATEGTAWNLWKKGFVMNVLNPKVTLFFLALLPQFISAEGWNIPFQMMVLGIIFMIQGIIIFVLIALLAGRLTKVLARSGFWNVMKWIKVGVLSTLGITLLFATQ